MFQKTYLEKTTQTTKCLTSTLAIYHLWWAPKLRGPVVSRGVSQSACVPPLSQMGETDGPSDPLITQIGGHLTPEKVTI